MDTRNKIVERGSLPLEALQACTVVIGYFDPVYADHARRLRSFSPPLIVAIDDPPEPLLPWRARAELIAGFGCVEYVVPAGAVDGLQAARIIDQRADDERARQSLVDHVLARHPA